MPQANGDSSKVKVKVRVNINGLFNVSGATVTEKVENPPAEEQEPMEVDGSEGKTQDAAASMETSDNQQQQQQPAAEEGSGESPKDSSSVNDIADVEPANKDATEKVCIGNIMCVCVFTPCYKLF